MKWHWPAPNRTVGFFDVLGLIGLGGLLVGRYLPVARLPFWGCALRQTTGIPCPACGLTRVADHFSHGEVGAAWLANPLGTVAAALCLVLGLWTLAHLAFKVPVPELKLSPREATALRISLGVALFANYAWMVVRAKFPHLL